MTPTSDRYVYPFDAPPAGTADELRLLLGGKGANLVVMSHDLGLPVPPGFTITTEACRAALTGEWPHSLDAEIRSAMDHLGSQLGSGFGDASNPLLVSVRSGAPVSMPGMMDTVLNLGLNDATVAGMAEVTTPDFASDCLQRFHASWASVIGGSIPQDPWDQLKAAVAAVFASWNSDRARAYRAHEGIPDDLGTAVTVQAMVFGNRGADSATGVVFTRNPSTGQRELYGDVLFNAQGEDVVAGTHATEQISALDARLPAVAADLRRTADILERHNRDLCDIEFTIEDARLWMLQVRVGKRSPRAALRMAIEMAEDESFPLTRAEAVERVRGLLAGPPHEFVRGPHESRALAVGLPASPGVASGPIATSSEAAERVAGEGSAPILVRPETSPEDVRGMAKSAGVLTASGGLASHAAVVARGWGIPAVVGASAVTIIGDDVRIGEHDVRAGDILTVDGGTGEVFLGELAGTWMVAPEAATLLAWANELGIEIAAEAHEPEQAHTTPVSANEVTIEDLLVTLAIKGGSTLEQLLEVIGAELAAIEPLIKQMQDEAFIETAGDQVRLSPTGKLAGADAIAASRSTANLDEQRAAQLLGEFHALDARMKVIVTGWQIRDVAGEQVLNDHTDTAYDAGLLDDLAALDRDTSAFLDPLTKPLRAFHVYRSRLGHALELARAGDQRYVASPRVDSYHSVWFELHEHLIRLAGQKRSGTE